MYLRSRNVSSVINPTDFFLGNSVGSGFEGPRLGKSEEGKRSSVWKKVSRGSQTVRERDSGPKPGGEGGMGRVAGQLPQDSQMPGIPLAHSGYIWYEFQAVCRPLHV